VAKFQFDYKNPGKPDDFSAFVDKLKTSINTMLDKYIEKMEKENLRHNSIQKKSESTFGFDIYANIQVNVKGMQDERVLKFSVLRQNLEDFLTFFLTVKTQIINLPKSNYKSNDAQQLDKIKSNLEAMHKIAELALNKHIELFFYDKRDDSILKENQYHCLNDLKNYIKRHMEDFAKYSNLLKRDGSWCNIYDVELSQKIEEYLKGKYNREQKLRSVILK